MSQTVVLNVKMSCQGCAGAVQRVLGKLEGVESFDIDLKEQKVTVKGNVQPEAVFEAVSKTGKKTAFWEAQAPPPTEPEVKPVAEEAPPQPEPKPAEATPADSKDEPVEAAPANSEDKPAEAVVAA